MNLTFAPDEKVRMKKMSLNDTFLYDKQFLFNTICIEMKSVWVIGLMSGILDGIDAALLRTNGLIFEEDRLRIRSTYDPIFIKAI